MVLVQSLIFSTNIRADGLADLHQAVGEGDTQAVERILDRCFCGRVNINEVRIKNLVNGDTALNIAISNGDLPMVELLLKRGARTDVSSSQWNFEQAHKENSSPFDLVWKGHGSVYVQILSALLDHGLDIYSMEVENYLRRDSETMPREIVKSILDRSILKGKEIGHGHLGIYPVIYGREFDFSQRVELLRAQGLEDESLSRKFRAKLGSVAKRLGFRSASNEQALMEGTDLHHVASEQSAINNAYRAAHTKFGRLRAYVTRIMKTPEVYDPHVED